MKRSAKKLILSCTALLAFSTMAFGLVSINDDVTVEASQGPVTLSQSASIRLAQDENDANGIRFESTVTKDYYESTANAIYGTLICPADYLSSTNVLCHDDTDNGALYLYNEENDNVTTGNQYAVLDLRALPEYVESEEVYVFKGSITNVKDNNLARPFAARSYVGIPNGNGGYTYEYSDVYSRSIYSVATHVVAYTEKFEKYTPDQQSYLVGITDKVAPSITAFSVTTDKTGAKLSTDDEITVSAKVTVDTKHYDGELDVAPLFKATVDGVESATALKRVGANVYTLDNLGECTVTPYVGKIVAEDISFTCNKLSIFTKASDITKDETGKLVNPYISSSLNWSAHSTGNLGFTNATVGTWGEYENVFSYDIPKNTNLASMIVLRDTLLNKISIGTWLVFDIYMEDSANDKSAQYVYRANGGNDNYLGGTWIHTANYDGTTNSYVKTYMYGIDKDDETVTAQVGMGQQWYNNWGRVAAQFTDEGFENFSIFMRTDIFSDAEDATRKIHIKNMYLTTDGAPYCVEASGFDTGKIYTAGEKINLTATAYCNGSVVGNTTNEFTVVGSATLDGNVLTVGGGEIKITVTNSAMNSCYPVSRTYTIKAERWSDLAVEGIDETKTYAYNDIVEISATATKEGDTQAQTVSASYKVTSGSAIVWKDSEGKWYAKPGLGESEITASFAGEEVTVIFKGDSNTVMLLGGETEQGYATDDMLKAYFKNNSGATAYDYEMYNGRYAVNYNTHVNDGDNFEIKTEYNHLPYMNGWLYIDLYLDTDKPGIVYFTVNGYDYIYMFSSYNSANVPNDTNKEVMQRTEWQWYDMDGAPFTQPFNTNYYGRWVTLEMKLQEVNQSKLQLALEKYPNFVKNMYVSSVVISKTRLIEEKQQANAQLLNLLDDEQTFENYWSPAGANSEFTWMHMAGRNAVRYKSLQTDCSALYLDTIYKTDGYTPLLPKYNYLYMDFFVEEDKAWNGVTVMLDFGGISPTYLTQFANTQAYDEGRYKHDNKYLGFDYQWYVDLNNDGVLEPLTSAPTSKKGVWVTLEICIPYGQDDAYSLKGYEIRIEKYPLEANVDNDLYISNIRLSKNSLTGIVAQ